MIELPNRQPCCSQDVGEGMTVTVSYHLKSGDAVEVFLTGRGMKASDSPMTDALYKLGVVASKMMQKEDDDEQAA